MSFAQPMSNAATVRTGAHSFQFPAGTTLSDVRSKLALVANLSGDDRPFKGVNELQDNYILQSGDEITFTKLTGQKG